MTREDRVRFVGSLIATAVGLFVIVQAVWVAVDIPPDDSTGWAAVLLGTAGAAMATHFGLDAFRMWRNRG